MSHIVAFGANDHGKLGAGFAGQVVGPIDALAVGDNILAATGGGLALHDDGTVTAWGDNENGPHGTGSASSTGGTIMPEKTLIDDVVEIDGGAHIAARLADGTIRTWGSNMSGQIGDGTTNGGVEQSHKFNKLSPVAIPLPGSAVKVVGQGANTAALLEDGRVLAWGDNQKGQLADGTSTDKATPQLIPGIDDATDIAIGGFSTGPVQMLAVLDSGKVVGWGAGRGGQLMDTTGKKASETTKVFKPVEITELADKGIVRVFCGTESSYALGADGTLWAWGTEMEGQLGLGIEDNMMVRPMIVRRAIKDFATAARLGVALDSAGEVWTFGKNINGECGKDPTIAVVKVPNIVEDLMEVRGVFASSDHVYCISDMPKGTPLIEREEIKGGIIVRWRTGLTTEGKWTLGIHPRDSEESRDHVSLPIAAVEYEYKGLQPGLPYDITVVNQGGPCPRRTVEGTPQ